MEYAFSVGLYIKLFQIRSYFNDFQTLNNPGSGQPVGGLKKLVLPSIFDTSLTSLFLHHHRHRRVVRVNRCAAPWPLVISDLHSVDSSIERWHPPELVEPDVSRATWRSSPAGHCLSAFVGIHHQTQIIMCCRAQEAYNMPKQREASMTLLRNMSPMVDKPDRWSTSELKTYEPTSIHQVSVADTSCGKPPVYSCRYQEQATVYFTGWAWLDLSCMCSSAVASLSDSVC